jgi:hypothetical protein
MRLAQFVRMLCFITSFSLIWVGLLLVPLLFMLITMISLVVAPVVSVKSRHIEIQYHYIRQLSARSLIRLEYFASPVIRVNVLTKVFKNVKFLKERDCMFNRVAYAETSF